MTKTVLFVDYLSPKGHISFNKNIIRNLSSYNVNITCVFYEDIPIKNTNLENVSFIRLNRPSFKSKNNILTRIYLFYSLCKIKRKVNFASYDYVIFSSFEETSLFFSYFNSNLFLFAHNNSRSLHNKIKWFFLKRITIKHTLIVFDELIKAEYFKNKISNVVTISHGLPQQFEKSKVLKTDVLVNLNLQLYDYIIFSPSCHSSDYKLLKQISNDRKFCDFLNRKNLLFLIKDNTGLIKESKNIKIVDYYLEQHEYEALFNLSKVILLPYSDNFKFRVSNVLYECIANDKLFLTSNNYLKKSVKSIINYDCIFDESNIVDRLRYCFEKGNFLISNADKLKPDYNKIFDEKKDNIFM